MSKSKAQRTINSLRHVMPYTQREAYEFVLFLIDNLGYVQVKSMWDEFQQFKNCVTYEGHIAYYRRIRECFSDFLDNNQCSSCSIRQECKDLKERKVRPCPVCNMYLTDLPRCGICNLMLRVGHRMPKKDATTTRKCTMCGVMTTRTSLCIICVKIKNDKYNELKKKGLCVNCKKDLSDENTHYVRCAKCRKKVNNAQKNRRKKLREGNK